MKFISVLVLCLYFAQTAPADDAAQQPDPRPRLFVTGAKTDGLRSLSELREDIKSGHSAKLWKQLKEKVDREMKQPVFKPKGHFPEQGLCFRTANRISDASLVALITNQRRYAQAALDQIDALFDPQQWPELDNAAHVEAGDHCSLRRGVFAASLALSYDWLHGLMAAEERARFVRGFDARLTRPFRKALQEGDRWVNWRNNFIPVIYGGFGIAGMSFAEDYDQSQWLIEKTQPKMQAYVAQTFGPEGEFNESVQYAGSTAHTARYIVAQRYHRRGQNEPLLLNSLDEFCRWYMHFTFSPGRVAGFGDPAPDMPPVVTHFAAVAAARREPIYQWFYMRYADTMLDSHRKRALELLYYDPTLEARSPQGVLPLGRAYRAQGKLISSRSSWDRTPEISAVYSKASREYGHSHVDWGQVCIDGYGERLIVDLKSGRGRFAYRKQRRGHNVFILGENIRGDVSKENRFAGRIVRCDFDNSTGGLWEMDLTDVYPNAKCVRRCVIHMLPRVVAVLDDAELNERMPIKMRWHTIAETRPDARGRFILEGEVATLGGMIERLDGNAEIISTNHELKSLGGGKTSATTAQQPNEPFIEIGVVDDKCRLLSVFCVFGPGEKPSPWQRGERGWSIETPEGTVRVECQNGRLKAVNLTSGKTR